MRHIMNKQTFPVNEEHTVFKNQITAMPSGLSHAFDTGYAMEYGVEEAIMIRNFQFFITANANRGHNFYEERFWTYDRLDDFVAHFPYWTKKIVRRILKSLVKQGVIIKGEFNENWSDRTQWFAFREQSLFIKNVKVPKTSAPLEKSHIKEMFPDVPKWASDKCPNGHLTNVDLGICKECSMENVDFAISDNTSTLSSAISSSLSLVSQNVGEPKAAKAAERELPVKEKRKKEAPEFSIKVRELGTEMLNALILDKPDYVPPKSSKAMLTEIDFMVNKQKRDPEKLLAVFQWAVNDNFWNKFMFTENPAEYLRRKYDGIDKKMSEQKPEEKPHLSNKKIIEKHFRTGKLYNGALCTLEENEISFQRGTAYKYLKYSTPKFFTELAYFLKELDIPNPIKFTKQEQT